jgi:pimeloyl-ACP methyl ester carboxylesterase
MGESGVTRRASWLARRVFWSVTDWLYAAGWQARSLGPTTAGDYSTGIRQPIVVVPGVYETWHFMRPLMDALHDRGHPIHVVAELGHNLGDVPDGARLLMEVIEHERLDRVLLLTHSKGGLIGKYAMAHLDPAGRIDRMIAIAAPFGGSAYARFAPVHHLRVFRATDPVLAALAREAESNGRITSIYGVFDQMIPGGSELAGATNVRLPVGGHFSILGDVRTRAAVVAAVDRVAAGNE